MNETPQGAALSDADIASLPAVHTLKTDPEVYDAVEAGIKTHEIRKNDRDFKVGDLLILRRTKFTGLQMHMRPEQCPLVYTPGKALERTVSHVLTGYGLQDGWCILSFAAPTRTEFEAAAYRWLRDRGETDTFFVVTGSQWPLYDEELDTAIAAAMGWPTVPEVKS